MTEFETWHTPTAGERLRRSGPEPPAGATALLRALPPLVFAGECDLLTARLGRVARGEGFVLHGADRTPAPGGVSADAIRGRLRTLLQMAAILTYAAAVPVVRIGRITPPEPGPADTVHRYGISAATLNLVRALTTGGYADLRRLHEWNRDFVAATPTRRRHAALTGEIDRALAFMRACGQDPARLSAAEFFASHEIPAPGTPLTHEGALTRVDSRTGHLYHTAAHLVRIAARTPDRHADRGAVLAYCAAIRNPLGIALGPGTGPDDALTLLDRLDQAREPGRVTFLVRMGAAALRDRLPALVEKVTAEGHRVAWVCDPDPDPDRAEGILAEATAFFDVHRALGTHPGGITVGLTPDDSAALDLAFHVAGLCRRYT